MPGAAVATVTVAHNNAPELAATLAAASAQLAPGDELVVVDNASTDGTVEIARAAAATVRVLALEANRGFAAGCHAGAAVTTAPLLFFLNPDTTPAPGCLDALRAVAEERPDWGAWQALVLLPGGERVNSGGGVTHWLGMGWAGDCDRAVAEVAGAPHEVSFASGAALVVRRAAWEASGGFDPAYFVYGEDLDLSLRLRLAGWKVGIVPQAHAEHDYVFVKGDYKWFHLERNRWWTVLGVYPAALLVLVAPALVGFELALLGIAARGRWLRPKLAAQVAVLRSLRWALRRRRSIQRRRRVTAAAFAASLSASLESPYLGGAARWRPLVRLQAAYWAGVSRLLRSAERRRGGC